MQGMISVVLPVFNESENLIVLFARLLPIVEKTAGGNFEVIFVDDGSNDGSAEILDSFHAHNSHVKVIHFSRNFGHQAALQAGLDEATGDAVILMDSDLQDPPDVLQAFVEKWRQGYEVVYAVRKRRKENVLKRASYVVFYRTLKFIADIDVPLQSGDFCLMDRRVVNTLVSLRERNRFLRGLRSWVGFKQVSIEYERDARFAGAPKYTLRKLMNLALSGYVGFSSMPLRAATWFGFLAGGLGFGIAVWVLTTKLMGIPSPRGWASTLAVILFVGGVQLVMLGVLGEYLGRVYEEVRQRPLYIVRSRLGIAPAKPTAERDEVPYREIGRYWDEPEL